MLKDNKQSIQKNTNSTAPKEKSEQEKDIQQGQKKMDAEGGNQGKDPSLVLQVPEPKEL